jgi:hypothetical protein
MQVITADLVLAGPDLAVEHRAVLVDGDRIAWGRAGGRPRFACTKPAAGAPPASVARH